MPETRTITRADLLEIPSFDADRPARVAGLRPPSTAGKHAMTAVQLVNHATEFADAASTARGSGLAPRIRAARIDESFARFAPRLEGVAKDTRRAADESQKRINAVGRLSYADHAVSASTVHLDLERLRRLEAMPVSGRAQIMAELARAPALHLDLAESLVRLPRDISGLDATAHAALRVALWAKSHGEEFDAMSAEMDELQLAAAAVREAAGAAVDQGITAAALHEAAPTAVELASSRLSLSWPTARPDLIAA